jgi:hypothetical protein
MLVKLFLDDLRPAPKGWILVKSAGQMMQEVLHYIGDIQAISLDNDLDEGQPEGVDFLQAFIALKLWVPQIYLHTANPSARAYMLGYLESANERAYLKNPIRVVNSPPPGYLENVEDGWFDQ